MDEIRLLLCALQDFIRVRLAADRPRQMNPAGVSRIAQSDTIYEIDDVGEEAILTWFELNWPKTWPVELVMEGRDDHAITVPIGTPVEKTMLKCIMDPIDGTRELMYNKRSAWTLAGVALQRGRGTTLADIAVAAMTELPISKQWRSDQFSVTRGSGRAGIVGTTVDVRSGIRSPLIPAPSTATQFDHGFSSFVRFFPHGKALIAEVEEMFWRRIRRNKELLCPAIFEDQYISTGGQLAELLLGHDRMIVDIRPLVYRRLGLNEGLTCHPYDICTELILREAGVVIQSPLGGALEEPLDTTTAVSWVGYANPVLAQRAGPILKEILAGLISG